MTVDRTAENLADPLVETMAAQKVVVKAAYWVASTVEHSDES